MATLTRQQLLQEVLNAVDESGWRALVLGSQKPFKLRLFRNDEKGFDARFYVWNCTHGGGSARADDEYRVQVTSVVPSMVPKEVTLLLGWHAGYDVFVAFDIRKHNQQNSQSPSIQVKESTLQDAHRNGLATYNRQSGEIAVAFRPELLVEYVLNSESLHKFGRATVELSLLNNLESVSDSNIATVTDQKRRAVVGQIVRRYRAADFRKRVLGAYEHRCAMCGVQLELIDAAHIIPVAAPTSTDETKNGIALCKLHHEAYDRNLISFDQNYKIEVSPVQTARLAASKLSGGLKNFEKSLRTAIHLPVDKRDYPPPAYVNEARKVRKWQ